LPYIRDLLLGQFGIDGQAQQSVGHSLGDGQVAGLVSPALVDSLQMDGRIYSR
jgi:hypothetical protein